MYRWFKYINRTNTHRLGADLWVLSDSLNIYLLMILIVYLLCLNWNGLLLFVAVVWLLRQTLKNHGVLLLVWVFEAALSRLLPLMLLLKRGISFSCLLVDGHNLSMSLLWPLPTLASALRPSSLETIIRIRVLPNIVFQALIFVTDKGCYSFHQATSSTNCPFQKRCSLCWSISSTPWPICVWPLSGNLPLFIIKFI